MNTAALKLLVEARTAARTGAGAEVRLAAGLSQGELARAVGVNPGTVSRWESRERQPSGAAALRYARILRVLTQESAKPATGAPARKETSAQVGGTSS